MVKHHIKSKKKNKASKKQILEEQKKKKEQQLNNLDRFAGSSEEDDSDVDPDEEMEERMKGSDGDDDTDDDEYDGDKEETVRDDRSSKTNKNNNDDNSSSPSSDEDEYNGGGSNQKQSRIDDDNDKDDDGDEWMMNSNRNKGQMKMAFAMSKILGLATSSEPKGSTTLMDKMKSKTPILSKTITPLQKLLKKEQEEVQAMKLKRKQRRITNLTALHKPLSAATSTFRAKNKKNGGAGVGSGGASSLATEIEIESAHRRVATRGVVALFNTIAKHQQQAQQLKDGNEFKTENSSGEPMKNMTKFGFLDMLKQTASDKNQNEGGAGQNKGGDIGTSSSPSNGKSKNDKKSSSTGWNALKDDFMMNQKLKDWDKELSGDEDDDNDFSDDGYSGKKRQKSGGGDDADGFMDDDSSSDDEVKSSNTGKRRKKLSS